jgi:tetratricopeptide (TPR) repeat protein
MKVNKVFIILALFVLVITGCAQKQVPRPAPADSGSFSQPQISVETLDEPDPRMQPAAMKETPQPLQRPIVDQTASPTDVVKQVQVLPSIEYVNDRIFEYGRKLNRWKELDEQSVVMSLGQEQTESMIRCFRDLQKVLDGYERLHDDLLQRNIISTSTMFDTEDAMELQKMDIAFIEGNCGRLLAGGEDKAAGWQERQKGADLNQVETLIERYFANNEYSEVVQVWLQIPLYQVERVDLKTKIMYGNALMYLDQQEKAAEIYQQIVDEMSDSKEQPTDILSLRKVLADLYTASGNYLSAEGQYEQISADYLAIGKIEEWSKLQLSILERSVKGSPELTEFSRLLRAYLGYLAERDGYKIVWQADKFLQQYPYSPVASNVDIVKEDILKRADEWFNGFITQVDMFASEKKFQDAIELLNGVPEEIIGAEKVQELKTKIDEIVLAEAVERETVKLARKQELQRRWNEGMLLADQDDFDGAIQIFTELLDTEYSAKSQVKIEELSLQAAKAARRKAADLFIRFTKTVDVESKKKLLVESRQVLKDILIKYPEVEISEKVLGNIRRVEKEMNELDPFLLSAIELKERENTMEQDMKQNMTPEMDVFDMPSTPPSATTSPPASNSLPVYTPQDMQ